MTEAVQTARGISRPVSRVTQGRMLSSWRRRLPRDPYLVPSLAIVIPVGLVAVGGVRQPLLLGSLVALFVVIQVVAGMAVPAQPRRRAVPRRSIIRWSAAVLFLAGAQLATGDSGVLSVAYLPIIGLAAAHGRMQAIAAVVASTGAHTVVEMMERGLASEILWGGMGFGSVAALAAIIIRLQVARLQTAHGRLRAAVTADRRRARQIRGVEAIGRILAASGPTAEALDQVVGRIARELDYRYVSIYLAEGEIVRLGAQRGYRELIETFDGSTGIVGRVMRTREPAFLPEVALDPEYWGLNPDVRSEICAPLLADGEFLGFVNVESTGPASLDTTDLRAVVAVADRVAAALIIGRERQALAARVDLFRHLHEFTEKINSTLKADELYGAIVQAVPAVINADITALSILDRGTGRYLLRAISGAPEIQTGTEIQPGEGVGGRAIRDRTLVIDESFDRSSYPATVEAALRDAEHSPMQAAAVPLVRDRAVVGALTILRRDASDAFSQLDRDALAMIGEQAALAVANAFLHAEVEELAIRDPLTELYNRRHLEPAMAQLLAQRSRLPQEERPPISVVMFDLDHFSDLNNRYGHQAGDTVLRHFGEILRRRLRSSDLVARIGGEEFAAVLFRATVDDALRVAEEVRRETASMVLDLADGTALTATVSAGCAAADADKQTPEALLRAADVALYMAKRAGRNRVVAA